MNFKNIEKTTKTGILQRSGLIVAMLLVNITCFSQSELRLSLGSQSHFTQIQLESSQFESSVKPGVGFITGISLSMNENFSVHSGIGMNFFKSRYSINNYSNFENSVDISGEDFEFRYTANNYSERQNLTAMSIPLAVQYETTGSRRFYAKLGVEANVFISQQSYSSASSLTTTGFFPRFNAVLDSPSFAGFGTYENQEFNASDLDLKNSYNATVEIGIKQIYASGNAVYVGAYYKYGINDISGDSDSNGLVSFDPQNPTAFRSTSVLNALDRTQGDTERLTSQAKLHMFGVTLRYEFSL